MTPFEQGYKAFLDGVPKDGNPFDEGEPWSNGKWLAGGSGPQLIGGLNREYSRRV